MKETNKKIDWFTTLTPLLVIVMMCISFVIFPDSSKAILGRIRFFFGDTMGFYYLIVGIAFFVVSLYIAYSDIGSIRLGKKDSSPKYSFLSWGTMMFTCGLAADILFYSFSEWIYYYLEPHVSEMGKVEDWVGVYPLFHWSLIPWSFYLVLAVAFGFMLHIRKREKQRYSEACFPILKEHTYGIGGRVVDLLAIFALLAGTATTFSVATPLMSSLLIELFHIEINRTLLTIIILLITCVIYSYSLLHGFKGIGILAKACFILFIGILAYAFIFGGKALFIVENGLSSMGLMIQNFVSLSTYTDPLRENYFPQNWTIYYWAYWMVWCVATPFFIGKISEGRTIRQVIVGGYIFGAGSTLVSFIILGNYSLGSYLNGELAVVEQFAESGDIYESIISILRGIPGATIFMVLVFLTMLLFYSTSFDSIAFTVSCYSYQSLGTEESPSKKIQLMWCVLLILLPIVLVFSENSMTNLQTVSIVAAFPIGIVMIMIVIGFLIDSKHFLKAENSKKSS